MDHKPLVHVITSTTKPKRTLERLASLVEYIAQFSADIHYIAGAENSVTDTHSQPGIDATDATAPHAVHNLFEQHVTAICKSPLKEKQIVTSAEDGQDEHLFPISWTHLAAAQNADLIIQNFPPQQLEIKPTTTEGVTVLCSTAKGKVRPVVPVQLRRQIFEQIRNLAHPGKQTTVKKVTARYCWPGATKDITT